MSKRVSSTVTKRKANPRPRKYASASERQAAYRDRAPEVCFRAEPKTVETLDRIADTLDRSRAELLLSMTKFALTNHDWARFGLTHKPLPFGYGTQDETRKENPVKMTKRQEVIEFGKRMGFKASAGKGYVYLTNMVGFGETFDDWDKAHAYVLKAYDDHYVHRTPYPWDYKENPAMKTTTKRKPTPAQLAARERFAEMARSGAFKKAGASRRKANPAKKTHVWRITVFDDDGRPAKVTTDSEQQGALLYAKSKADANMAGEIHYILPKSERLEFWFDGSGIHPAGSSGNRPIYTTRRAALRSNPAKPAAGRRGNPVKYRDIAKGVAPGRVQYAVHMPDRPSYHAIAYFTKKADAVDTAQELSDRTGKPVAVTRVQVHFGAM
jgi:hypothetical protein